MLQPQTWERSQGCAFNGKGLFRQHQMTIATVRKETNVKKTTLIIDTTAGKINKWAVEKAWVNISYKGIPGGLGEDDPKRQFGQGVPALGLHIHVISALWSYLRCVGLVLPLHRWHECWKRRRRYFWFIKCRIPRFQAFEVGNLPQSLFQHLGMNISLCYPLSSQGTHTLHVTPGK